MKTDVLEKTLASGSDLLSRVLHISPALIMMIDVKDGAIAQVLDVNDSFLHNARCQRENVIGKELAELKIFPQLFLDPSIMQALTENGFVRDVEMSYYNFDDEIRYVTAGIELFGAQGSQQILIAAIDITERSNALEENRKHRIHFEELVDKRTGEIQQAVIDLEDEIAVRRRIENELIEETERAEFANQAKSDFLANMSHELRTPLNSVIGFSELMLTEPNSILTPEHHEKLRYIHESGRHLMSLINDILDLSKIEAGKMLLHITLVDVDIMVANLLNLFGEKAASKEITLCGDLYQQDLQLLLDERKLKQIFFNLISNAIKFTPASGTVTVKVEPCSHEDSLHLNPRARHDPADYLRFSVIDTGIGISEDELEKIFHPFYQIDSSFTRKYPGTGLGLTLSRQMVELHGGVLWAESSPGEGSKFRFLMPKQASMTS